MNRIASEIAGQLALVTGASRGLGRQIAIAGARRGCRMALVARTQDEISALAQSLTDDYGCEADAFAHDLSQAGSPARCAREITGTMGPVDILVNNAGSGWYKPFTEHAPEEHDLMIDLNFRAVVHLTQVLLPPMLARGSGHIVNIASDLSLRPLANMAVYAATKHAMRGFSRSLFQEVRPQGIKVTQANPGMIDSLFGGSEEGDLNESGALETAQLAETVMQVLEQPGHQLIDEIEVHAMLQNY